MSIYGTYQRHEHLGTSNKRLDVWYKAAAIATILGVGAYNLLTSIATRRKTREIEDLLIDRVLKIPENTVATIEAHEAKQQQARSHVTDVQHERRLKEPAHSAALET